MEPLRRVNMNAAAQERERRRRGSSQKTMLSRALQKANTAVLLDNAANYEGAIDAYSDACDLLMQVMRRTDGRDEKQKLEEIRTTYTTRIGELRRLGLSSRFDGKALPERPLSDQSFSPTAFSFRSEVHEEVDEEDSYIIETATATRILNHPSYMTDPSEPRTLAPSQIPPRRQSLLPSAFDDEVRFWKAKKPNLLRAGSSPNLPTLSEQLDEPASGSNAPLDGNGFQHHQSPSREPPPPPHAQSQQSHDSHQLPSILQPGPDTNHGSTSWLDNGDSGGSSASSLRSRSSSLYLRKRDRAVSGGTEAEFDAALDAAVEAAYDEGLEPMDGSDDMSADDDIVLNVRRNVERAKQKVREAELEAEAISAKERETRRVQNEAFQGNFTALDADYEDEEAEEEKLILEEMMDVFEFDVQSKSALPRQSGSSGYSGRTWGSSIGSNAATIGTSLSTLAEEDVFPSLDARLADSIPTTKPSLSALPTTAMPPPPPPLPPPPLPPPSTSDYNLDSDLPLLAPTTYTMPSDANSTQSVRARRLSGRDLTELSIETNTKLPPDAEPPKTVPASRTAAYPPPSPQSKDDLSTSQTNSWQSQGSQSAVLVQRLKSGHAASGSVESITAQSPVTSFPDLPVNEDGYETAHAISHRTVGKPVTTPDTMRKDTLSSHSKPLRAKVSSLPAEETSRVPESPFVSSFSASAGRKGPHASFSTSASASGVGGHFLFDGTLHSPMTPGYPNPSAPNAPDALEPCPQSFLLRPFWLLRCLYQTIAHPRGAYLTTKLFIPRDVWRVKNVKLKAIEEKISNCDLLTAALLKVAQVDTNDADAVLEEMQALESILDQVQAIWSKKLGSEVGVHGAMNLFKSSSDDSSHYGDQSSKSTSGGGKSYLTSWRKLRSKSSGPNAAPPSSGSKDSSKDTLTLNSLPMSETLNFRAPKRNVQELKCSGPNANYMHALARLCDAAQVVDQIARQVEDPGLKHSSQTLVGLELSTRHAAEFFGFYVCRFALNDIGLMIDKFVKRGSEWVLA